MTSHRVAVLIFFSFVSSASFSQNSPFVIWGSGLDGSNYQKLGIYADTQNGFLLDAPKDANGNRLDISFNWRGGGIPPLFIRGTDANVGVATATPWEKLHVNGSLGVGTWSGSAQSGLQVQYTDYNGGGTSVFKHSRWYSAFYFKRNGPAGERTQLYIGGGSDHVMEIYNDNNEAKIRLHTNGDSHLNGGNVGIGTTNPDAKLAVKGDIHTQEVRVDVTGAMVPDYVFEKGYNLLSLPELQTFIEENKHLPEVPSSTEMETNGLQLKEMNLILLKKVEELTLYLIAQQKEIEALKRELYDKMK